MMETGGEPEPEREPLQFEINLDNVPLEMGDMMRKIKKVSEKLLYHWKTFPIVLPHSITENMIEAVGNENAKISFKDLFVAPTFDELEEVATDANGELKKLTDKQLNDVKFHGEFDVESIHFPGQVHRWHLSELIQKGTIRSRDSLLHDTALAVRIVCITARNRFYSHFFSLSESLKSIAKGLWQLLDILIGMPSTTPGDLLAKIREERMKYLIAEMDIKGLCKVEWTQFCEYVREKSKQLEAEKHKTADLRPPPVPYLFQTPKGFDIDLRLFNKDIMKKCMQYLKEILEREAKGWFLQFKDNLMTELRGKSLSPDEITEKLNEEIMAEYLRRVYTAIVESDDIESISPGIGQMLVSQAKCVLIMSKAAENVKIKMQKHQTELKSHLVKTYPVRSKIKAWVNERLNEFEREFISQNLWSVHEEAIQKCKDAQLDQAVYFLNRDLNFMRERELILCKELSKVRNPTREYTFHMRIWMPYNWIIRRQLHGESEVIQTVVMETPTAITQPRSDPNLPTFTVDKHINRRISSRYPFWRWMAYMQRTWSWMWNAMFWLGLIIPWCSPVSLRALILTKPFMPDLELSQVNGALCPKVSCKIETLVTRLRMLWTHIREARTKFENEPDTGFLGKSFTRHVNRIWNFVCKGAFGSVGLVLFFPPVCLLSSLLSLSVAALTPLWMPLVTFVVHVSAFLLYDFDNPRVNSDRNSIMIMFEAIIWRLLILGFIQPIGAFIAGTICCPIATCFVQLGAVVRYGGRRVLDAIMFHAVIRRLGRVPSSDGFVARRVQGPGLASNFYYQIRPEQALAALEAKMELQELNAWGSNVRKLVEKPVDAYRDFVSKSFGSFSATLSRQGVFETLDNETKLLQQDLARCIEERSNKLHTGLTPSIKTKVKLTTKDIKMVIAQAMQLVQNFYPQHVINRLPMSEENFWESKNLEFRDWKGLTCQLLGDIFSSAFLTPLEETDKTFFLEVQHLNLIKYVNMLKTLELRDDLDVVNAIHTPKGELDIMAPFLEASVFDPRRQSQDYSELVRRSRRKWPWKKPLPSHSDLQKLEIPPPVPHPTLIAITIYNREHDQHPIKAEDATIFARIMRAAEKVQYYSPDDDEDDTVDPEDIEASTPDHTTVSDPDVAVSHLAVQERAFSEDNMRLHGETPSEGSRRDSDSVQPVVRRDSYTVVPIYSERAGDNSCVVQLDQQEESTQV